MKEMKPEFGSENQIKNNKRWQNKRLQDEEDSEGEEIFAYYCYICQRQYDEHTLYCGICGCENEPMT